MARLAQALALVLLCAVAAEAIDVYLYPSGAGSGTWVSENGGNKWDDVDDTQGAPDDDTTSISITNDVGLQQFPITTPSISAVAGTIDVAGVYRCKEQTGDAQYIPYLVVNGSAQVGATQNMTASYATASVSWTTNPHTAAEWLESEIETTAGSGNLTGIGLQSTSMTSGDKVRCTQMYVTVSYTDAGTNTNRQLLLGVGD